MLRTFFLLLLLAGAAAFGVYLWLLAPAMRWSQPVAAGAPDAANGETIFDIGGCSSCHAVPNQPDRLKLGGGPADPATLRYLLCAQHLARSQRWHRTLERGGFRHRGDEGRFAWRNALLPGVSLYVLR